MPRGRTPARHDEAARVARVEIQRYLDASGLTPSALAHAAGVSPSSALRVLAADPPKWTPAFSKLARFVESRPGEDVTPPTPLDGVLDAQAAAGIAQVLRSLADLIEGLPRKHAAGSVGVPAAARRRRG